TPSIHRYHRFRLCALCVALLNSHSRFDDSKNRIGITSTGSRGALQVRPKAFRLSLHCLGQGALEQFKNIAITAFSCNQQGSSTRPADCFGISATSEQRSSDSDVTA